MFSPDSSVTAGLRVLQSKNSSSSFGSERAQKQQQRGVVRDSVERTRQESGVKNKAADGFLPSWLKREHLERFVPLTQVHIILT